GRSRGWFGFWPGRLRHWLFGSFKRPISEFNNMALMDQPVKVGNHRGLFGGCLGGLCWRHTWRLARGRRSWSQGVEQAAPRGFGIRINVVNDALDPFRNGCRLHVEIMGAGD